MYDSQQQPQQGQPFQEMRQNVNMLVAVIQIIARMSEVFLRRPGTWGERYCGLQFVLSWIFCFCFSSLFYPREDPRPMLSFWLAATALLLVHRICGVWRRRFGYESHSLYSGRSWFAGDEIRAKTFKEPIVTILVGVFVLYGSTPLGVYLIVAGICLGVANQYQAFAEDARVRQARDARIDAEILMQRLRQNQ
jgi:hypothetical protein